MPPYEVGDTVVLKDHPSLIGHVERTNTENDFNPLDDKLIIAHVELPGPVIQEFATTSVPPKGYVFVEFTYPEDGSSLINEQDLILLNRSLDVGDIVKKPGNSMTGNVINVSESFLLQPICHHKFGQKLTRASFEIRNPSDACTSECPQALPPHISHPRPHQLIYNVPGEELKYADDAVEGDFVIYKDWVGTIDAVEVEVVLALEDESVVVLADADELHLPIPPLEKPLISVSEYDEDDVSRPELVVALQGWPETIPLQQPRRGQFVVTNRRPLRAGRWLQGSYNKNVPPQGIVLDVRARELEINWSSFNIISAIATESNTIPKPTLCMYENLKTYRSPNELRRKKGFEIYDSGRQPRRRDDLPVDISDSLLSMKPLIMNKRKFEGNPITSQDFNVGDHVKFRDVTAAAVKYQGQGTQSHGKFNRVKEETTGGWDLNEFKIIHVNQTATVMWLNGEVTIEPSTSLGTFSIFEPEIVPTDIVLRREGLKQVATDIMSPQGKTLKAFNEMTFFEEPHDLYSQSVGIIQRIDPQERVAQVRWFQDPILKLSNAGYHLGPKSKFGRIGDHIEEVSIYEIMTFPALVRHCRSLVIMTPASWSTSLSNRDPNETNPFEKRLIDLTGAEISEISRRYRSRPPNREADITQADKVSKSEIDWIGEIVHLGLDGSITVRLGASSTCEDIQISHDGIIDLVTGRDDEPAMDDDVESGDWSDEEESDSDSDRHYFIRRDVEYEGGERLDDDSGDENWLSMDEDIESNSTNTTINGDSKSNDAMSIDLPEEPQFNLDLTHELASNLLLELHTNLPTEAPPAFSILDGPIPSDQFNKKSTSSMASSFLKTIRREHKILSSALPEGQIYVRTYETRLDLLRCLIIGPKDTPYEYAPFVIDLCLGEDFPKHPPTAYFHSWTGGLGRINPNLYEDGKICLSLLGTWPGKTKQESWSEDATILQILLSLQGLVLRDKPFYNEAGFEEYAGEKAYTLESQQYNEKAYVMARDFVKHALSRPPHGLQDILAWLYLPHPSPGTGGNLIQTVIDEGFSLVHHSEEAKQRGDDKLMDGSGNTDNIGNTFLKPLSTGASLMLKRTLDQLVKQQNELSKTNAQNDLLTS